MSPTLVQRRPRTLASVVRALLDAIPDSDPGKAEFKAVVAAVLRNIVYMAPESHPQLWMAVRAVLLRHFPAEHPLHSRLESIFCDRRQRIEAPCATQSMADATDIDKSSDMIRIEDVRVQRHADARPPASLDLSLKVTKPANQGLCGSCWAISTTQCLRDRTNARLPSPIPELSFQFVIDCAKHCVSYRGRTGCAIDCNGGFLVTAYKFLQDVGTPREGYHPNRHAGERGIDVDGAQGRRKACRNRCRRADAGKSTVLQRPHHPDTFGITNARMKPLPKTEKSSRRTR